MSHHHQFGQACARTVVPPIFSSSMRFPNLQATSWVGISSNPYLQTNGMRNPVAMGDLRVRNMMRPPIMSNINDGSSLMPNSHNIGRRYNGPISHEGGGDSGLGQNIMADVSSNEKFKLDVQ